MASDRAQMEISSFEDSISEKRNQAILHQRTEEINLLQKSCYGMDKWVNVLRKWGRTNTFQSSSRGVQSPAYRALNHEELLLDGFFNKEFPLFLSTRPLREKRAFGQQGEIRVKPSSVGEGTRAQGSEESLQDGELCFKELT